jgi:TonB family protein
MAFRALLFSKSPETNTAMTTACGSAGIRAEVCSDIFTAIEQAKTRSFSCVIVDWADQPEASFLLKRARESAPNQETVAIAIIDHEPSKADMQDNRLGFLIYRPISALEADEVLAKACEQMQPASGADRPEASLLAASGGQNAGPASSDSESSQQQASGSSESHATESTAGHNGENSAEEIHAGDEPHQVRSHAVGLREILAIALVATAVFCLWKSRDAIEYLAHTPEGKVRVLKESVAALFYMNQSGALPVGSVGSDAQQDAYFSRNVGNSQAQNPTLELAATESTLPEMRAPLPKAYDFPLPQPVFEHQEPPPIHVARAAIPESMRNSPSIERPVVVTVNPAQMMPISAPQPQIQSQQENEPVAVSEAAARALLVHSVDPVYPPEGVAQKLHGAVVLQALVGRDGSVEDLKIVRGYFILGRAAIAAVKQWRFQPNTLNGHAASMQTVLTINFSYPPG